MSGAFIKGVTENLTEAEITFDKFHVVKLINDAVDKVRRAEVKSRPELKRHPLRLAQERGQPDGRSRRPSSTALAKTNLKTARACHLRLAFQDIYKRASSREWARVVLDRWYRWAIRSRLEPMKDVAAHHQASPRRHPRLVRQPHRQRPHRGHQQPRPGRQGQGARLPHAAQPQGHHLPRSPANSTSGYPREIAGSLISYPQSYLLKPSPAPSARKLQSAGPEPPGLPQEQRRESAAKYREVVEFSASGS